MARTRMKQPQIDDTTYPKAMISTNALTLDSSKTLAFGSFIHNVGGWDTTNGNRLVVPKTGFYQVNVRVQAGAGAGTPVATSRFVITFSSTGTVQNGMNIWGPAPGSWYVSQTFSVILYATAGSSFGWITAAPENITRYDNFYICITAAMMP